MLPIAIATGTASDEDGPVECDPDMVVSSAGRRSTRRETRRRLEAGRGPDPRALQVGFWLLKPCHASSTQGHRRTAPLALHRLALHPGIRRSDAPTAARRCHQARAIVD